MQPTCLTLHPRVGCLMVFCSHSVLPAAPPGTYSGLREVAQSKPAAAARPQCPRDGCLPSLGSLHLSWACTFPFSEPCWSTLHHVQLRTQGVMPPRRCCGCSPAGGLPAPQFRASQSSPLYFLWEHPICRLQAFEYPADLFLDDEDEGAFSTASMFGEDDTEVEDDAEYEDDRSALFVPETEDQDVDSSLAAAILGAMTPRELAALDSKEEPAQVSSFVHKQPLDAACFHAALSLPLLVRSCRAPCGLASSPVTTTHELAALHAAGLPAQVCSWHASLVLMHSAIA